MNNGTLLNKAKPDLTSRCRTFSFGLLNRLNEQRLDFAVSYLFVGSPGARAGSQAHLFQANYYRDPSKTDTDAYKTHSQLAQWENEGNTINATLNENFAKTDK